MIPPMQLDYLSWEAFATLVAVIAAFIVGRRQVGIAARQTDIQTEQTRIQNRLADLEELKLRQALFDARYQVYNASRKWLVFTIQHGSPPYSTKVLKGAQKDFEMRLADEFLDAVDRSRFLFRPTVRLVLFKMWESGQLLTRMERTLERDTTTQEQREKAADSHDEAFTYLNGLLSDYSELFGDELVLTAHSPLPKTSETQ